MPNMTSILEKNYLNWIKEKYNFSSLDNDVTKIETPFLDSSFDNIILYVERMNNGKLNITDDGWNIDNLMSEGITFSKRSKTRRDLLDSIAKSFGVDYDLKSKEISIKTTLENFPEAKHRLLMAIMRINDISYLNSNNVKTAFVDDVQAIIEKNNTLYTPNINIAGSGGITFHFDFSIPTIGGNEKLVRTIATPNNLNQLKILSYDVNLTSKIRKSNYFAVLNDSVKPITNYDAIKSIIEETNYPIQTTSFSELIENPDILSNKVA